MSPASHPYVPGRTEPRCPCCGAEMHYRFMEYANMSPVLHLRYYQCDGCSYWIPCNKDGVMPATLTAVLCAPTVKELLVDSDPEAIMKQPQNRGMDTMGNCTRCGTYISNTGMWCPHCDGGKK